MIGEEVTPFNSDEEDLLRRGGIAGPNFAPRPLPAGPANATPGGIPKPTANEKTPPLTLRGITPQTQQRTEQDQNELQRLQTSGSGISQVKNPIGRGILKGLNVAGSVLGAVDPFARAAMPSIPGTEEHHQRLIGKQSRLLGQDVEQGKEEAATGEATARADQAEAAAEKERADTAAAGQPKPKEEIWKAVPGVIGPGGKILQEEQNSGQVRWAQGIEGVGPLKETKESPAHITYDSGIPVSVVGADGKVYDVNDPKLPPELRPLVEAATRAHGQHTKEDADKQARAFAQQEHMHTERQDDLTANTKNMVQAAPAVLKLAERIGPLIDSLSNDLGPTSGRWSEFWAGKVGGAKPEYTKLRTDVGLLTTKLMQMHVGSKGGEMIMQHFKDLIDVGKQSPENMKAALGEIVQYAHDVQAEAPGGAPHQAGGQPTGGGQPHGATMKVPGSDGRLHWSDGKSDLGVVQ